MSERPTSIVRACQEAAVERLQSLEIFDGVPVLSRLTADLVNEIDRAVAELGLCVLVLPPLPSGGMPKALLPTFARIDWAVRVIEDPLLNTLELDAYTAAEAVLVALHGWRPDVPGIGKVEMLAEPIEDNSADALVFDCKLTSAGTFYMKLEGKN